jgi:hypothetical protein
MMNDPDFRQCIQEVSHRYDTPPVLTNVLVEAVRRVAGYGYQRPGGDPMLDVLDVIREIIPSPSIQDVRVATWLIGNNYEAKDIGYICAYCRMSKDVSGCNAVCISHREALAELLEAS